VLYELIDRNNEKRNKTICLAGWQAGWQTGDLQKHDIWPIFSDLKKSKKSFGRLQGSA
jgi:hypothetical protein